MDDSCIQLPPEQRTDGGVEPCLGPGMCEGPRDASHVRSEGALRPPVGVCVWEAAWGGGLVHLCRHAVGPGIPCHVSLCHLEMPVPLSLLICGVHVLGLGSISPALKQDSLATVRLLPGPLR